eukprot:g12151.t1
MKAFNAVERIVRTVNFCERFPLRARVRPVIRASQAFRVHVFVPLNILELKVETKTESQVQEKDLSPRVRVRRLAPEKRQNDQERVYSVLDTQLDEAVPEQEGRHTEED